MAQRTRMLLSVPGIGIGRYGRRITYNSTRHSVYNCGLLCKQARPLDANCADFCAVCACAFAFG
eukprot:1703443-Rhodomonas_salina.1